MFVREATGLVREHGLWIAFVMCLGTLNLGLDIPQLYYSTPATLPGTDVGILLTITLIPVFFWGLGYAMMGALFPRSGGDYVWTARALGGVGGFALGWFTLTSVWILGMGYNADISASFILSQAFAVQGAIGNNAGYTNIATWLASPTGIFIAGSVILIVSALVVIFGSKPFKYVQTFLILAGFLGLAVMVVAIAGTSHSQFIQVLNTDYGGNASYQNIINLSAQQGVNTTFSWRATILALPFSILIYAGLQSSVFIAGETKNARRNIPLSIALTILVGWAFMTGLWYLMVNTFGADFITAVGVLAFVSPNLYPLPVPPTMNFFGALVANNVVLSWLIGFGFIAWAVLIGPNNFMIMSRILFGMSFDRVMPAKFAEVNERFHSPVIAVVICLIGTLVALALFSFTNIVTITIAIGMAWGITAAIAGLAMIALPFTRKQIFEQGPSWVKKKFGPIPALSIVGVCLTVFMLIEAYFGYISSSAPMANIAIIGFLVVGIVLYYLVAFYRKRQGLDLSLVFKEIPPE